MINVVFVLDELSFFRKVELFEGENDSLTKRVKVLGFEPVKVILVSIPVEGGLKSVYMLDAQLFYKSPCSGHFVPRKAVCATLYLEERVLAHQKRKQFLLKLTFLLASVDKTIKLLGVAM